MLGFQAEAGVVSVGRAVLAAGGVGGAGGIELDGGLVGDDFHVAAGFLMVYAGRDAHGFTLAEHEVVIVTAGGDHLGAGVHDLEAFLEEQTVAQVQGRIGDGHIVAGGDQVAVDLGDDICLDRHNMVLDGAVGMAAEVEVGVVGEVAQGRLVGFCLVADDQVTHIIPGIGDGDIQVAGIVFLAVRGDPVEGNGILMFALLCGAVPETGRKADVAAVKVVDAVVVQGDLVVYAVDGELAGTDAVTVAADRIAHAAVGPDVLLEGIKAQGDIVHVAAGIRNDDGGADGPPFNDRDRGAHGIGHGKLVNVFSFGGFAPDFRFDGHGTHSPLHILIDENIKGFQYPLFRQAEGIRLRGKLRAVGFDIRQLFPDGAGTGHRGIDGFARLVQPVAGGLQDFGEA